MDVFIKNIVDILKVEVPLSEEEIEGLIEIPPDLKMGDFAFPCFALAKQFRNAPGKISADLAQKLTTSDIITDIKALGPYLNFYASKEMIFKTVLDKVFTKSNSYGNSDSGAGKTAVIDYSSPNIAKHLAVHHLRSAVIGNAIHNIYKALGYNCVGINHLGDWGTQFGQLIVAFKKWGPELKNQGSIKETGLDINKLNELYVRFHKEAKNRPFSGG